MPQRWGNTPWNFIDDHNEEWGFLRSHILQGQMTSQPDIWAQITVPNEFQPVGKYNIGITAGIETTVCVPQWIEGMNRMNLNLVSSEHSKKVFLDSKFQKQDDQTKQVVGTVELTTPIEVLFEGVDITKYFPVTLTPAIPTWLQDRPPSGGEKHHPPKHPTGVRLAGHQLRPL